MLLKWKQTGDLRNATDVTVVVAKADIQGKEEKRLCYIWVFTDSTGWEAAASIFTNSEIKSFSRDILYTGVADSE